MIESCQLPFQFDAQRLREELDRAPRDVWISHFNAKDYQGDWTVVPLRSLQGNPDNIYAAVQPPELFESTELLKQCPYFQETIDTLHCAKTTVRLMRLGVGSEIKEHADSHLGYEDGVVRIHIPIQTHPDVEFYLRDQRVPMREGECWYLNFNLPHRVVNGSPVDRIHLVMDCLVDDWFENLFKSLGFGEVEQQGAPGAQGELTPQQTLAMIENLKSMDTETSRQLIRALAASQKLDIELK